MTCEWLMASTGPESPSWPQRMRMSILDEVADDLGWYPTEPVRLPLDVLQPWEWEELEVW